jgi:tetratricopeptide (TPR) repeat protein
VQPQGPAGVARHLQRPEGVAGQSKGAARQQQPQRPPEGKADALAQAAADLSAGRRAEAAAKYRVVAAKYDSVEALLQLARIQSGDGDASGALATLVKARELAPSAEDVLSAYAQVAMAVRSLPRAMEALDSLTRVYPDVAQHHYLYGIALMQLGDMITAVDVLQRASQLEPDRPLTLIALGLAFNNRKMFTEADPSLSRALELEPDNLEAIAAMAETDEGLGRTDAAESRARRVLAARPNHATANLVLGLVLMRAERFADARDAFLRASAADPASPKPDYQLSLAYARLGDGANSQKHLALYQQKLRDVEKRINELRGTK